MSEDQRQELLHALLNHYCPGGFEALLREACTEAIHQYEQTLIQHAKPNRQRDAAALPPPPTHEESAIPATLEAESAARASDGHEHASSLVTPSEPLALGATLSASDASSNRLSHARTHERDGVAISGHEQASKPPTPPADDLPAQPDDRLAQSVNGRIPVNPLLRYLDAPSVSDASSGKITSEIVRRSTLRDPCNWR